MICLNDIKFKQVLYENHINNYMELNEEIHHCEKLKPNDSYTSHQTSLWCLMGWWGSSPVVHHFQVNLINDKVSTNNSLYRLPLFFDQGRENKGSSTKSDIGESILELIPIKNNLSRGSNYYSLYQQSWKLRQRKCHHKNLYTRDWNIEHHKGGDLHPFKACRTAHNHFKRSFPLGWPRAGEV